MVQGTTPTFVMTLPNSVDLTEAENVYFTLKQLTTTIQKDDPTVTAHEVSVYLSQEETLQLAVGNAQLQLNWTYANGERACSNIVTVPITENLIKEVLS